MPHNKQLPHSRGWCLVMPIYELHGSLPSIDFDASFNVRPGLIIWRIQKHVSFQQVLNLRAGFPSWGVLVIDRVVLHAEIKHRDTPNSTC